MGCNVFGHSESLLGDVILEYGLLGSSGGLLSTLYVKSDDDPSPSHGWHFEGSLLSDFLPDSSHAILKNQRRI